MTDEQIDHLRQLTQRLAGTDITLVEWSGPDRLIRLRREAGGPVAKVAPAEDPVATAPPVASPVAEPPPTGTVVHAASVGVVLLSHPLRAEPLVRPGQAVRAGETLALLRIGLVLLPVAAPRAGTVSRIVATHEDRVGYGAPLIELT
jgi:acetyl-CoA carboxylase biotin carboxyl carrier protein